MAHRFGVLGVGAVGARVARQLVATFPNATVFLADPDDEKLAEVSTHLGLRARPVAADDLLALRLDVLIVAAPAGRHLDTVLEAIDAGVDTVSTSDRLEEVEALVALDAQARAERTSVLAGVGFAPGLTCVLATYLGARFDSIDEIHIAKQGTGGPACARQHHRALSSAAKDWRDGGWVRRPGGSGRELVWFPDPVGARDCYRAALADAWLMRPAFPDTWRVTARVAATRQDRFTSWLPMLTPPHPEGGTGAVRVEIRGRIGEERTVAVVGAVERPAVATAAVVATAVGAMVCGWGPGAGVRGLATAVDPRQFLRELARRGVTAQEFVGLTG